MKDWLDVPPLGWKHRTQREVICAKCGEEYLATFQHCWETGTSELRYGCPACGWDLIEEKGGCDDE